MFVPLRTRERVRDRSICVERDQLGRHRLAYAQAFERMRDTTATVRKMYAVLREQSLVDGRVLKASRESVGRHVRNHQRQYQTVAARHLEDDENGRYRRTHHAREDRAHPYKSERANLDRVVMQKSYV